MNADAIKRVGSLLIYTVAVLTPMYVMASTIDQDEWNKTMGSMIPLVFTAIAREWLIRKEKGSVKKQIEEYLAE